MPYQGKKIAVVMPAYNAARTLRTCYETLPKEWVDLVILVDDASTDNTMEIARSLPLLTHAHPQNRGYGGNQKTCYRLALQHEANVAIMVHPDHQYDPQFIPEMIRLIVDHGHGAVFGSRMMIKKNALRGGMPYWKFLFNILLTKLGNWALGTSLTELHSGFRAYDCAILRTLPLEENSDDFVFDTQIIIQLAARAIPIKEIPIATRYFENASQIKLGASIRYGLGILHNLWLYKTGRKKF